MRIAIIVLLLLCQFGVGWLSNQPQKAGLDVPQGKLNSLSFAPYREGQNPFEGIFPSAEQVALDVALMASKTHTIRTYASDEGTMPAIPPLAKRYGLTMLQGAWLGAEDKSNQKEIQALIKAATAYPEVVQRVIVGNEALLRGDLKAEAVIAYLRQVKQAIKQPVSYADVWSMYMKNPQLFKEVDFITVHILPYWEDEPISAEQAAAHIERIYKVVKKQAEAMGVNKPILIGETGWPSAGRQRGNSVPSVVNEARVVRNLLDVAKKNGFDVNIVEAINQSWKYELEGVVGANWGLFSVDRKEVFPLVGKVYERAHWLQTEIIAMLLFLMSSGVCWRLLNELSPVRLTLFLVFMQLLCNLQVRQVDFLWYTSYSNAQREFTLLIILLSAALGMLILRRSLELLTGRELLLPRWFFVLSRANFNQKHHHLARVSHCLFVAFVGYAMYASASLSYFGRYVSFPNVACMIAVVGIAGLMCMACLTQGWTIKSLELNKLLGYQNYYAGQDRVMGLILLVLSFGVIAGEMQGFNLGSDFVMAYPNILERFGMMAVYTFCNGQLLTWLGCLFILALPLVVGDKHSKASNDWLSQLADFDIHYRKKN